MSVLTKADLRASAIQVRDETLKRNNTATRVGSALLAMVDSMAGGAYDITAYGAVAGVNTLAQATLNTAAIQAACNAASAAGGGIVSIPPGSWYFWHGTLDVNVVCQLNDLNRVAICGAGVGITKCIIFNGADASMFNLTGATVGASYITIRDLEIDGNRANQTAGIVHGIRTDLFSGLWLQNLYIHDISHYGIGVEGYSQQYLFMSNIKIENTGGDGFDQKNKADANMWQVAANITVTNFGLNTLQPTQAGWDCRGAWQMSNYVCHFSATDGSGIRFRNGEAGADPALGGFGGHRSHFSNFEIYGPGSASTAQGIECVARDVHVSNGYIRDVFYGVAPTGLDSTSDSKRSTFDGITVENVGSAAFITSANTGPVTFIRCRAITALYGFRARSSGAKFIDCNADSCTTSGFSTDTAGTFAEFQNCRVVGVGGASMVGVDITADDTKVMGGDFSACYRGIVTTGKRTKCHAVSSRSHTDAGFLAAVGGDDASFVDCYSTLNGTRGFHSRAARTWVNGGQCTSNTGAGLLTEATASDFRVDNLYLSGNGDTFDDSGVNSRIGLNNIGLGGLVGSSVSEGVAAGTSTANIDIAIRSQTTYQMMMEVFARNGTGIRSSFRDTFQVVRGTGAPTLVATGSRQINVGTGLDGSRTISANNLRVSAANNMGLGSTGIITTRIWEVERLPTV